MRQTQGPMRAIGIDPGLGCTGIALVRPRMGTANTSGWVCWIAAVGSGAGTFPERLGRLCDGVVEAIRSNHGFEDPPDVVAIEGPSVRVDPSWRRSVRTLPAYGMAIGAIFERLRDLLPDAVVLMPAADDWSRGWMPLTRGDAKKQERVKFIARTYADSLQFRTTGANPLGPKSIAGNLADAIGLAQWALWHGV